MDELKPCPFCRKPFGIVEYQGKYCIEHDSDCQMDQHPERKYRAQYDTPEQLVADLNRRPNEEALVGLLMAEIKAAVIENGATVKGENLQAVYAKGRVSWDTKTLDGLMMVIPQLERARKVGEPSVSIRKV